MPPAFGVICSFAASCNLCETFSFLCRARPSVSRMATVVLACGSRAFACYCVTGLALLSDSDGGGRKELEHACRCHARPRFPLVGICGGTATCNRRLRLPSLAGRKKFVNPARLNNNNNNREVTARLNKNKRPKAYVTKTTEKSSVHQKKGETQSPTARQAREGSRAVNRV